jgi:SAM-dependent methyltransferase
MDLRCTTDRYDVLYARWLESPGTLLDLARWEPGMRLMDLCGGTGAVSREAIRRGANAWDISLVDINPRAGGLGVHQVRCHAEDLPYNTLSFSKLYDVIVCRQAMAYLQLTRHRDGTLLLDGVRELLVPGGRFAFNLFARPRWAVRPYRHNGRWFVEASGFVGRRVGHLQWAVGEGADLTGFRWHKEREVDRVVSKRFAVQKSKKGRSIRWVLTKPED